MTRKRTHVRASGTSATGLAKEAPGRRGWGCDESMNVRSCRMEEHDV